MSALLEVQALSARQGARTVLRDVGFEVAEGELWAVLGPNGAGKSTLLRTLLGLHPRAGGAVLLRGVDVGSLAHRERARRLAWVPQGFDASVGFSGLELVLMGRSPHLGPLALASDADEARARAVLEELGLLAFATRSTATLSGGELRMLLLARALVQAPELLLLDEPTAFLDLRHQVTTLEAVRRRVRSGLGAVAVLHDVNLAATYADRVLLLGEGQVLGVGSPAEVLTAERLERLYRVTLQTAPLEGGAVLFTPRPGQ